MRAPVLLVTLGALSLALVGVAALFAPVVQLPFLVALQDLFLAVGILSMVFGVLALLPSRGVPPLYSLAAPSGAVFVDPGAFTRRIPPSARLALVGFGYGLALIVASAFLAA